MTIGMKPQQPIELNATKSLGPWQERVVMERELLNDKIGNLTAFLSSEKFGELPEAEQDRLTRQLDAMTTYRSILSERIKAWVEPEPTPEPTSEPAPGTV
jgi:hypothetical protein